VIGLHGSSRNRRRRFGESYDDDDTSVARRQRPSSTRYSVLSRRWGLISLTADTRVESSWVSICDRATRYSRKILTRRRRDAVGQQPRGFDPREVRVPDRHSSAILADLAGLDGIQVRLYESRDRGTLTSRGGAWLGGHLHDVVVGSLVGERKENNSSEMARFRRDESTAVRVGVGVATPRIAELFTTTVKARGVFAVGAFTRNTVIESILRPVVPTRVAACRRCWSNVEALAPSFLLSLSLSVFLSLSFSLSLSRSLAHWRGWSAVHLHWSTTGTAIFVFLPHPPRPCPTTAFVAVCSLGVSLGSRSHAELRKKSAACDTSREQSTRSDRYGRRRWEIDRDFRMMHNNSRKYRPSNSVSFSLFLSSSSVFDVIYLTRLDIYLWIHRHMSRLISLSSPCLTCLRKRVISVRCHKSRKRDPPRLRRDTMPSRWPRDPLGILVPLVETPDSPPITVYGRRTPEEGRRTLLLRRVLVISLSPSMRHTRGGVCRGVSSRTRLGVADDDVATTRYPRRFYPSPAVWRVAVVCSVGELIRAREGARRVDVSFSLRLSLDDDDGGGGGGDDDDDDAVDVGT